jgi:hypothetical protein
MDLDELKRTWQEYDRKLEASIRLNTRLLQHSTLGRAETALTRLSRLLVIELVLDVVVALFLGSFAWDHVAEARFLFPAVTLHLCVIALIVTTVRQIVAIRALDFGASIVEIQRRLESLRIERIRTSKWALLLGPLVWTPLCIVTLKGFFDCDVYATFGSAWVAANVLFGLAVIVAGLWASKQYGARLAHSSVWRRLADDLAGSNMKAATRYMEALSRFQDEGEDGRMKAEG